jgi:hypothetical protein
MMDHIQNNNAGSLWDKLTATGYSKAAERERRHQAAQRQFLHP